MVAAKCALAARVDSFHESTNGHIGQSNVLIVLTLKYIIDAYVNTVISYISRLAR